MFALFPNRMCRCRNSLLLEAADRDAQFVWPPVADPVDRCTAGWTEVEMHRNTCVANPSIDLAYPLDAHTLLRKKRARVHNGTCAPLARLTMTKIGIGRVPRCYRTQGTTMASSCSFQTVASFSVAAPNSATRNRCHDPRVARGGGPRSPEGTRGPACLRAFSNASNSATASGWTPTHCAKPAFGHDRTHFTLIAGYATWKVASCSSWVPRFPEAWRCIRANVRRDLENRHWPPESTGSPRVRR